MPQHFNPFHFDNEHFLCFPTVLSAFGRLLVRTGEIAEVLKPVTTSTDDYGNPVVEYQTSNFHYASLKILSLDERFLIPGTTVRADAVGFFESNVDLAAGYRVSTVQNQRWQVLYVKRLVIRGKVHHIEAHLKRLEVAN